MNFHAHSLNGDKTITWFEVFDPRSRVVCALFTSLILSSLDSWQAFIVGAFVPLFLFFTGNVKSLSYTLLKFNLASLFICVLLPLTYPGRRVWGIFSLDGFNVALLIILKLNFISIITIQMIGTMGMDLGSVLKSLKFPNKLSMLIILTMRYIFLLTERVATMTRAVSLRSPHLRGKSTCLAFACMLGTTLIHSSDRAERSILAIKCRGGTDGFFQSIPRHWSVYDTFLCIIFALNGCIIVSAAMIW